MYRLEQCFLGELTLKTPQQLGEVKNYFDHFDIEVLRPHTFGLLDARLLPALPKSGIDFLRMLNFFRFDWSFGVTKSLK